MTPCVHFPEPLRGLQQARFPLCPLSPPGSAFCPDSQERRALNIVGLLEALRRSYLYLPRGVQDLFMLLCTSTVGSTKPVPSRGVLPRTQACLHSTWTDTWLRGGLSTVRESLSCLLVSS